MNKKLCITLVVLFAIGFAAKIAPAQSAAKITVPFAFAAGATEFPAGVYVIRVPSNATYLLIRRIDSSDTSNVSVITRISPRDDKTAQVVFDRAGEKYYLAEVYIPGIDGFHLQGAPGKHTHTKVAGK